MLSFELGDELGRIQATVRDFAQREIRPALRDTEKKGPSPALEDRFAELGLSGLDWPEAAGGQGLSAIARAIVEEELAAGDLGAAFALDRGGAAATFLRAVQSDAANAALKELLANGGRAALAAAEEGKAQDDFQTLEIGRAHV